MFRFFRVPPLPAMTFIVLHSCHIELFPCSLFSILSIRSFLVKHITVHPLNIGEAYHIAPIECHQ
ncbi:hypothetical cytosolic protein [Syntrophus aciditrophicus SB]|uniref:Hypothetical cytosolic protein n=1 Tax=Syntrophus aciditrophicus (strain SB) TaxID=56780 RepID=Q2LW47_SYNAS|nr:hypothetical cytosolic protein [Syntrophus aciditrophicus SB]